MDHSATARERYCELSRDVRARGFYTKPTLRMLSELILHIAACLGGIALFVVAQSYFVQVAALLLSTAGALGISTNSHTSSHNATSDSRQLNRTLTYFGYPLWLGLSATYWWHKHCVVHHPAPNLIGLDDDVDLMPWFAITQPDFANGLGWRRLFYRIQWFIFPFALSFNAFNAQITGWRHLLAHLLNRDCRRTAHWVDMSSLLLHWTLWLAVPMLFFNPLDVVGLYVVRMMLFSYAMFAAFVPAHFPAEAGFVDKSQDKKGDLVLRQTVTTVNFKVGLIGRLLCSGVQYQIEHHLFPGVPHVYYPKLSPLVRRFCEENGCPYRTLGWAEAVWKSLIIFRNPKKVAATFNELRDDA